MAKSIFKGDHVALVSVLSAARRTSGLTQAQVAERIGRNQSHVSLIEMGQRRVDVVEFVELARALEVDPLDLFSRYLAIVRE